MPRISVIVPAYNAEDTLGKTLTDILGQSFTDFELIVVNDGSTDRTGALCNALANSDKRIRVVHQNNGGLSNARNNGTIIARGDYVTFIDSDDRIEPFYLENLIRAIDQTGADIACGKIDRVRENYEIESKNNNYQLAVFDNRQAIKEMLTGKNLTVGACCRLVPTQWQVEEPFLDGTYYEDLSNTYKINLKAQSIVLVDTVLYHYTMRGGSITGRKTTTVKQCTDYYKAIKLCSDGVGTAYPDLKKDIAVLMARDFMSLHLCIKRCKEETVKLKEIEKEILFWMRKNWFQAVSNPMAPISVRLRVLLFHISPKWYEKLYYIGIRIKGKNIT